MIDKVNEGAARGLTEDYRTKAAEAWRRGSEAAGRLAITMQQRVLATETGDDAKNLFLAHEMVAYEHALRNAIYDAQSAMHAALLSERFSGFTVERASNASAAPKVTPP